MRTFTAVILRAACALGVLLAGAAVAADQPSGAVSGRYVVKLATTARPAALRSALSRSQTLHPLTPSVESPVKDTSGWYRVCVFTADDPGMTIDDVTAALGRDNIEWIEPDYYLEFFDYPQDSLFSHQWYLHNTGQQYLAVGRVDGDFNDTLTHEQGVAGADIGISYYYEHMPAVSTRVVVAILDSGTDLDHPDLRGRFWNNADEIPANGLDDDHNGYVDDTLGYDISGDSLSLFDPQGDNDPTDSVGHGTHIAGIVAAAHNAGGIAGVASAAVIMPIKIRPNGTSAVGAAGIVYAVNAGADVINISWGTPYEARVLEDALNYARANGVFVAIAAGNSGGNDIYYPAGFTDAFAVAASTSSGFVTSFSTWGPQIDVVAPGQDILSLRAAGTDMYVSANEPLVHIIGEDSAYYLASGTSMACPMVAGAAAMMLSVRPDISLDDLESMLRLGATDMIDPFNGGDSLPGPDSISGFGLLNVHSSLSLAVNGGIFFVTPTDRGRYVDSVQIRAAAVGGYAGGWQLDYSLASDSGVWHTLGAGPSLPFDSLLCTFHVPGLNSHVNLRLTDDFGVNRTVRIVVVSGRAATITSPSAGDECTYYLPIVGSLHGPDFDSASFFYRYAGGPVVPLHTTTGEFFDSLIFTWNASGIPLGEYALVLRGYFGSETLTDSVPFVLMSAFAQGWPRNLTGRGSLTAVTADLDGNGMLEVMIGTSYGLNAFDAHGEPLPGYPTLVGVDARCIPAVYDVDRDGEQEIICASANGLHVFNRDGSYVPGWPVVCYTGIGGFGYPVVSVVELNHFEDSAIVLINRHGDVLAYEFDGDPYFYSLEGWFASFHEYESNSSYFGVDAVSSADLTGDLQNEVVVAYSALTGRAGIGVYDGRTGQPAFDRPIPQVIETNTIFGSILTDLTGDALPEIVAVGEDTSGIPTVWAITQGDELLPGFPVSLPSVLRWRGNYPMVADLDLDGSREILCTFFEFDIGALYVFRADGRAYSTREGRPYGEAYRLATTFGVPIVANVTGDERPEIIIRSGYIFPNTGREHIHILDHAFDPIPGWPVATPSPPGQIFSTPYAPSVDDIDGDGRVELLLVSEAGTVYAWDFDASSAGRTNTGRMFVDATNSGVLPGLGLPTGAADPDKPTLPSEYRLAQNYPNPFNPATTIAYELPARTDVLLEVFNILGQRVTTLVQGEQAAGRYEVPFDGSALASGVYLYRLKTDTSSLTRRMVLLK